MVALRVIRGEVLNPERFGKPISSIVGLSDRGPRPKEDPCRRKFEDADPGDRWWVGEGEGCDNGGEAGSTPCSGVVNDQSRTAPSRHPVAKTTELDAIFHARAEMWLTGIVGRTR